MGTEREWRTYRLTYTQKIDSIIIFFKQFEQTGSKMLLHLFIMPKHPSVLYPCCISRRVY